MDFNFRNKPTQLKTLDIAKITNIVNKTSVLKQREEQLKIHLNQNEMTNFLNEIAKSIKNEANEYVYRNTIELLMEQYENTIKPIIQETLKEEQTPIIIDCLKKELQKAFTDLNNETGTFASISEKNLKTYVDSFLLMLHGFVKQLFFDIFNVFYCVNISKVFRRHHKRIKWTTKIILRNPVTGHG